MEVPFLFFGARGFFRDWGFFQNRPLLPPPALSKLDAQALSDSTSPARADLRSSKFLINLSCTETVQSKHEP